MIDSKKYYFLELPDWFNLEPALQTNGVTKIGVKEVIKELLKNALKRKGGEKNANDANDMINTTNDD